ncbi:MAG: sulfur carrier protein ThiS [Akkermansiaceae bacterium]
MMTLTINSETRDFPSLLTLPALLEKLDLAEKPVVVELNAKALSPSEFDQPLNDGDQLEIIVIAAGG